jgi:hypothetical protein
MVGAKRQKAPKSEYNTHQNPSWRVLGLHPRVYTASRGFLFIMRGCSSQPFPGDGRLTRNLIVRGHLLLIHTLECRHTQDEEIELVRVVGLEIANFLAEGNSPLQMLARCPKDQQSLNKPFGPGVVGTPVIWIVPLIVTVVWRNRLGDYEGLFMD